LNLNNASAYYGKGEALYFLMQYAEAFEAYEQAVRLDPSVSVRVQEITALKKKYKDWLNKYSKLLYIYIIIPIIIFILGIILSSNGLLLVISIGLFFGIFGINFAREILDFMYARHIYNKMSKTLQAESATLQTGRDD
jgi:tetratricopeptide (TPR) repeat protein